MDLRFLTGKLQGAYQRRDELKLSIGYKEASTEQGERELFNLRNESALNDLDIIKLQVMLRQPAAVWIEGVNEFGRTEGAQQEYAAKAVAQMQESEKAVAQQEYAAKAVAQMQESEKEATSVQAPVAVKTPRKKAPAKKIPVTRKKK